MVNVSPTFNHTVAKSTKKKGCKWDAAECVSDVVTKFWCPLWSIT